MPDLLTRPIRPALVMSPGMMPALDFPGLMMPGQFGPMMRVVPVLTAYWKNWAVSMTGTPSVMTTHSGTPASTVSFTAPSVNFGGTNTTETLAPVAATASATVSNTGMPSSSWPALPGVTPATTVAPLATIRRVCLVPSWPVMPCTRIRLFSSRKIAMTQAPCAASSATRRAASSIVSTSSTTGIPAS